MRSLTIFLQQMAFAISLFHEVIADAAVAFPPHPKLSGRQDSMRVSAPLQLRVYTHNLRYATKNPGSGEKPWSDRKTKILNEMRFVASGRPDALICCQEALKEQVDDVLSGLNATGAEYAYLGVGRDDGKEAGEYSPIFYRPDVWQVSSYQTVLLPPETHCT